MTELRRGAFGLVYQAYDEELDCLVALKVLRPELASSATDKARFEREVRAAAGLRHEHVVIIHGVGHTPGFPLPYFVMEYLDGEALSARLERQEVLEPREAAELVRQAALGLAAAHARRLVHRDVKPSNLMLVDGGRRVKLTDFGLARRVEVPAQRLTQSGAITGTVPYMSPEQIVTPEQIDARSNLYSLGVVLYEALTGTVPFTGVTHMVLQQVVLDEPRPPRQLNDAIPRDLETICLKALAKKPERRYQTAQEMGADLGRWLNGEPIRARPVGRVEKAWR